VTKFRAPGCGGSSRTRASTRVTLSKRRYFDPTGSSSVKTVADRHRHAAYGNKQYWQALYWCQRRWPWTLKIGVFSDFFAISGRDTHFKSELRRNGWRWTWTICVWHFQHRTCIFKNLKFRSQNTCFKVGKIVAFTELPKRSVSASGSAPFDKERLSPWQLRGSAHGLRWGLRPDRVRRLREGKKENSKFGENANVSPPGQVKGLTFSK